MKLRRFIGSFALCSLLFACISISLAVEVAPDVASDTPESAVAEEVSASSAPLEIPQPFQVTLVASEAVDETVSASASVDADSATEPVQSSNSNSSAVSVATHDLQTPGARLEGSVVDVLVTVLGEYAPATYQTVTYMDGATVITTEVVPGLAGLDWPWLAGVGIFGLMLLCLSKFLGGLFK